MIITIRSGYNAIVWWGECVGECDSAYADEKHKNWQN